MEVASFATFARTGSPKRPLSSLCNDSFSSRSALALTSSRVAAYVSAFSCASFLARRTKDCNSSTASYRWNMFNGRFRCLRRVINASSVLLRALSSSKAFNFLSRVWIRSTRWETRKNTRDGMENASDVRLTRTEPRHNNQTQKNREMKFSHTSPPFVVETSPVFASQNLRILSSTTRFHSPVYPPLNNLTPLKIFFPYKMNAPPLPFSFQLRTLSSPTFYQQFVWTINLPFRHFLSLSSSRPPYLSSILPASYHIFFLISFFPYIDYRHVKGASLPSPHFLLSFSNLPTPSKNFPRRLHISCFFFSCWFSFAPPLFLSLLVWHHPKGALNICTS